MDLKLNLLNINTDHDLLIVLKPTLWQYHSLYKTKISKQTCKFSASLKLQEVVIFCLVLEKTKLVVSLLPQNQAKSSPIPENIGSFQVVTSFVARWHAQYLQQVSQGAQTCLATGQPGERGTRDKPVAPEPPVDSD